MNRHDEIETARKRAQIRLEYHEKRIQAARITNTMLHKSAPDIGRSIMQEILMRALPGFLTGREASLENMP